MTDNNVLVMLQQINGDPTLLIHSGSFMLGILAAWVLGFVGYIIRSVEDTRK